jgi:ATP-dependent Clp protease ATP-binding subunit ClpA
MLNRSGCAFSISSSSSTLFGKLVNGGEVKVRIKDNAPAFEIVPAAPKPSKAKAAKPKADKPKAAAKKKASGDAPAAE